MLWHQRMMCMVCCSSVYAIHDVHSACCIFATVFVGLRVCSTAVFPPLRGIFVQCEISLVQGFLFVLFVSLCTVYNDFPFHHCLLQSFFFSLFPLLDVCAHAI